VNAEAWFARLHSPDCTNEERTEFEQWLRADPSNTAAYEACKRLAAMSGDLKTHHALVDELLGVAGVEPSRRRALSQFSLEWKGVGMRVALAAAATISVVALGLHLARSPLTPSAATATTAKGQQRELALDDGSRIELNTDTVVEFRLTASERRVELKRGEAFFDVAKDPARPFIVRAGSTEVRVVGTQFSMREEGGRLHVVVKEGKVEVVPDSARVAGPGPTKVQLTPGKRLTYDEPQNVVRIANVDTDRSLIWRSGVIDFDSATLEEVLSEANRYGVKPLVIEDSRLRDLRVSGRFRAGDIDALAFALKERFGVETVELTDRFVLRGPGR
jgi:transmembrane sensor